MPDWLKVLGIGLIVVGGGCLAFIAACTTASAWVASGVAAAGAWVTDKATRILDFLAGKASRAWIWIQTRVGGLAGERDGTGAPYSDPTRQHFLRQLQEHGARSLERSLASLEARLAEHIDKLAQIQRAGGFTSSVEREIANFNRQIQAIKDILGL